MTFNKCSIRGQFYGYVYDEAGNEVQDPEKLKAIEFADKADDFEWYDQKLLDAIKKGDKDVHNFFALLSLCHTVMPEEKDGKLAYQAQSPDENALVSAARTFGFVFLVSFERNLTDYNGDCLNRVEHRVQLQFGFKIKKKRMIY
jgi:phospholipid-translocating ATPase